MAVTLDVSFFETAFERVTAPLCAVDDDRRFVAVNAAFCRLVGRDKEQLVGTGSQIVYDEEERGIEGAWAEFRSTGKVRRIVLLRQPGGPRIEAELDATAHVVPGVHLCVLYDLGLAERDAITRREIQAKLFQQDRLANFGLLAAGVAHEITNPLTYALTNAEWVRTQLGKLATELGQLGRDGAPELAAAARRIEECSVAAMVTIDGLGRVRRISQDLRRLARDGDLPEQVDLRETVEATVNVARSELRAAGVLTEHYERTPLVLGSRARFGQVFLNLLLNAAQAIPQDRAPGGNLRVRTGASPSGEALVEIADDGVGIEAAALPRIFDAFYSTKDPRTGTGLGLHISRSIVEAAGGRIEVASEPGRGTSFRVLLPAAP